MRFNGRGVATAAACGMACLLGIIVTYDLACFQPTLSRARLTIRQHQREDQFPPARAIASLRLITNGDTVPYATRLLMRLDDRGGKNLTGIRWQLKYAAWCSLVAFHLSENERLGVIGSLSTTGAQRQGLVETAMVMFGRPLSSLSSAELATLAVLIQTPSVSNDTELQRSAAVRLQQRYERSFHIGADSSRP